MLRWGLRRRGDTAPSPWATGGKICPRWPAEDRNDIGIGLVDLGEVLTTAKWDGAESSTCRGDKAVAATREAANGRSIAADICTSKLA